MLMYADCEFDVDACSRQARVGDLATVPGPVLEQQRRMIQLTVAHAAHDSRT